MSDERKFQVRDRIRFIESSNSALTKGKVYTVLRLYQNRDINGVYLQEAPLGLWWYEYRFELVEQAIVNNTKPDYLNITKEVIGDLR